MAAIAASTEERAIAVAGKLGISQGYGDWKRMLDEARLDAVSMAVPPVLQCQIVEAAAARNIAVFCEKPAAADVPSARQMLRHVEEAHVVHAMNFLFPEIQAWKKVQNMLETGAIGTLRHAALTWRVETYSVRQNSQGWKRQSHMGGGTLNSFVSHSIFCLEWLFGPLTAVTARLFPKGGLGDDRVEAWLEFRTGLKVSLSVAADCPLGSGHRLEVYGDEGSLLLHNAGKDYVNGFQLSMGTRKDPAMTMANLPAASQDTDGRITATKPIVVRFVSSIVRGADSPMPNLGHGLRVQEILGIFRESDHGGHRVEVPAT